MIKALIIDDEEHCVARLTYLIEEYCNSHVAVLGSTGSIEEGLVAIPLLKPDLVFLDVKLGTKSGFDLLQILTQIHFDLIFTTAYEEYSVKAFRFCALDYLLKPFQAEDLQEAIAKVVQKISQSLLSQKLDIAFQNVKGGLKKICVPVFNGFLFMQVDDIIRCQSDGNYTHIYLKSKSKPLLVAKTLKQFEELLVGHGFFRIHHSHLVNLLHVNGYHKGKGGYVMLADGSEIEVSVRRKDEFLKYIAGY